MPPFFAPAPVYPKCSQPGPFTETCRRWGSRPLFVTPNRSASLMANSLNNSRDCRVAESRSAVQRRQQIFE